jgi:single-strand DNA-binding protein
MNHVNLIGRVCSTPTIVEIENGRRIARFTMTTSETYLDRHGTTKSISCWHRLSAWGNWVKVLEELVDDGTEIAIQGSLVTRYYLVGKTRRWTTEIEVNDMTIL